MLGPRNGVGVLVGKVAGKVVAHSSGFIVDWGSWNALTTGLCANKGDPRRAGLAGLPS
jgi:hypothetical protein